jgi:hypothetical protein
MHFGFAEPADRREFAIGSADRSVGSRLPRNVRFLNGLATLILRGGDCVILKYQMIVEPQLPSSKHGSRPVRAAPQRRR